jgi:hypothetical protein
MALSFGEDVGAVTLSWVAVQHPYLAATVVVILLVIIVLLTRWILASLTRLFHRARGVLLGI